MNSALDNLGFGDYRADAEAVLKDCKAMAAKKRRKSTRLENLGIPEEELLRQQQELFAKVCTRKWKDEILLWWIWVYFCVFSYLITLYFTYFPLVIIWVRLKNFTEHLGFCSSVHPKVCKISAIVHKGFTSKFCTLAWLAFRVKQSKLYKGMRIYANYLLLSGQREW